MKPSKLSQLVGVLLIVVMVCFSSCQNKVGEQQLTDAQKAFVPYKKGQKYTFKSNQNETLVLECVSYDIEILKSYTSFQHSSKYYEVETIRFQLKSNSPQYQIDGYLVPINEGAAPDVGYQMIFWYPAQETGGAQEQDTYNFPSDFENACNYQDSLFACNDTVMVNNVLQKDIYKMKAPFVSEYHSSNPNHFETIYYSKQFGIVKMKTKTGKEYLLNQ